MGLRRPRHPLRALLTRPLNQKFTWRCCGAFQGRSFAHGGHGILLDFFRAASLLFVLLLNSKSKKHNKLAHQNCGPLLLRAGGSIEACIHISVAVQRQGLMLAGVAITICRGRSPADARISFFSCSAAALQRCSFVALSNSSSAAVAAVQPCSGALDRSDRQHIKSD